MVVVGAVEEAVAVVAEEAVAVVAEAGAAVTTVIELINHFFTTRMDTSGSSLALDELPRLK